MDFLQALRFSRYATRVLGAHPEEQQALERTIGSRFEWATAEQAVTDVLGGADGDPLARVLRQVRRRVLLHTMARDLTGLADLGEVCAAVTHLAETSIRSAVALHHRLLAAQHGEPRDERGAPQQLIVIGMGKLGGSELNVSSDVDLVFVYPEEGDTDGPRPLSNREFFERLGRKVIAALHDVTEDGFVFRVDMRLRPYGESGPLAVPLSALEQYLVTQGRAWERYAWLKARPLTGAAHDELASLTKPFVFRKYLDFDAYEGLRDIHRQIQEQGKRKDYAANIKLGPGGIREIEFTVQALQLVRGGREPALQVRGTRPALRAIAERGLLPEPAISALDEAYVFLRNLEHRLQYRNDEQTQMLPTDGQERTALASAMGFRDTAGFEAALVQARQGVATQFSAIFATPEAVATDADVSVTAEAEGALPDPRPFAAIWRDEITAEAAATMLRQAGYDDPPALLAILERVRRSGRYLQLPALSQQRFDMLVPRLLAAAAHEGRTTGNAQPIFVRLLTLLESVSRRSAYLALMIEHPPVLPRLTQLMGASSWAADYLTRHPILLDELLDARVLLAEPEWDAWRAELKRLLVEHAHDPERQMDALRHFQHAQSFRLLAQDLAGTLSVERLADHLSALADIIIAAALEEVWNNLRGSHGGPPRFAVIGYGKLGGKELGYASDLDLVFLYDDTDDNAADLYARLARRLIMWLTATTPAGALYETDLRLRPDGAAGLVVSSLRAFCRYQHEHAWTWEHQALTRARFVAGDAALGAAFEAERERLLRLPRDPATLRDQVIEMRRKLHAGHPNPTALFDLKHDQGGMVDVEFAVQYLVLAHAHAHPALTRNAGNIALLGIAGDLGLAPVELARATADAYRHYRRRQHQLRLTGASHARVEPDGEHAHRDAVGALWQAVLGRIWTEAPARAAAGATPVAGSRR